MSLSGFIAYKRVGWTGQTPWNPTNLNIMDKGIKDNNDMIANLRSEVSALNSNIEFSTLDKKSKKFRTKHRLKYHNYIWNILSSKRSNMGQCSKYQSNK